MLIMPQMYVLWRLQIWLKAEIACNMGRFVSEEQFNIWRTQRVGYVEFFSTKLLGNHIGTLNWIEIIAYYVKFIAP